MDIYKDIDMDKDKDVCSFELTWFPLYIKSQPFFAGLVFCKTCYARLHGPQVEFSVFSLLNTSSGIWLLEHSCFRRFFWGWDEQVFGIFSALSLNKNLYILCIFSAAGLTNDILFDIFLVFYVLFSLSTKIYIFYAFFQQQVWQMIWSWSLFRYFCSQMFSLAQLQYSPTSGTIQLCYKNINTENYTTI